MREILFRGKSKSINKGEWIYGSFVEDTDLNACCIRDKSLVYAQLGMSKEDFLLQYNSDPKQLSTLLESTLKKVKEKNAK